jgi:hypothetical protein
MTSPRPARRHRYGRGVGDPACRSRRVDRTTAGHPRTPRGLRPALRRRTHRLASPLGRQQSRTPCTAPPVRRTHEDADPCRPVLGCRDRRRLRLRRRRRGHCRRWERRGAGASGPRDRSEGSAQQRARWLGGMDTAARQRRAGGAQRSVAGRRARAARRPRGTSDSPCRDTRRQRGLTGQRPS